MDFFDYIFFSHNFLGCGNLSGVVGSAVEQFCCFIQKNLQRALYREISRTIGSTGSCSTIVVATNCQPSNIVSRQTRQVAENLRGHREKSQFGIYDMRDRPVNMTISIIFVF